MHKLTLAGIMMVCCITCLGQSWSGLQLTAANTAAKSQLLSEQEKEIIKYINLARLFPADFLRIELVHYTGPAQQAAANPTYTKSLIKQLENATPRGALYPDDDLYEYAKCFAAESGEKGLVGHKRKRCTSGTFAECCSYGLASGRDIALQWLVDSDVPSLGHRMNCLDQSYSKIGLSMHAHKKYGVCAVADFGW